MSSDRYISDVRNTRETGLFRTLIDEGKQHHHAIGWSGGGHFPPAGHVLLINGLDTEGLIHGEREEELGGRVR
jgi:hypothetical protein